MAVRIVRVQLVGADNLPQVIYMFGVLWCCGPVVQKTEPYACSQHHLGITGAVVQCCTAVQHHMHIAPVTQGVLAVSGST